MDITAANIAVILPMWYREMFGKLTDSIPYRGRRLGLGLGLGSEFPAVLILSSVLPPKVYCGKPPDCYHTIPSRSSNSDFTVQRTISEIVSATTPRFDGNMVPEPRQRQEAGQKAHQSMIDDKVHEGRPSRAIVVRGCSPKARRRACNEQVKKSNAQPL